MKRSFFIHGAGILFTIIAFVAGSNWPRHSKFATPGERGTATAGAGRIDLRPIANEGGIESGTPPSGDPSAGAKSTSVPAGQDGTATPTTKAPLAKDEVASLIMAAIKSPSSMDRRLAFDRILQEMQSDQFTVEQAREIRSLMHKNGASGDQWRLFDYAWAARFPGDAIALVGKVSEKHIKGYLGNMLPGLASAEPETAIAFYDELDSKLQLRLRRRLYEGLIHHDPEFATNYVFDSTNPERRDWRPMDEFARQLADEQGLQASLDWAAELPEGSLRNNAWSALFAKWTSQDSMSASEALVEMPESTDRDLAINGFSAALSTRDPESAVIWASEIENPGLREAAMVRAGTRYFQQNPTAAAEWFSTSGLPATALGKMIPSGP